MRCAVYLPRWIWCALVQVVFIDELDAIAPSRGGAAGSAAKTSSGGGSVGGRLVTALLLEMDSLGGGLYIPDPARRAGVPQASAGLALLLVALIACGLCGSWHEPRTCACALGHVVGQHRPTL